MAFRLMSANCLLPLRNPRALFKATKACTAAVEGASTADRELAAARQALTLAIKESSDDYTLLAAEIRHTDARRRTQWADKILLTETPKPRRKREPEKVDSDDPAELKEKKAVTG